jgi:hypothetical protein
MLDRQLARGIFDLITRYSREPAGTPQRIALTSLSTESRSNNYYKTQIRDRLRQRFNESRAQEVVDKLTERPSDIFDLAIKGGLKSDELDQIADDFIGRSTGGGQPRGRINPMRAPRAVLLTLRGIAEPDVDKLLASRRTLDTRAGAATTVKIGWVMDSLGEKAIGLGDQITGRTYQWSADILATSGNGRAFKRVRIVVDSRSGTPTIVYRRDLTDRGFPMDKQLLADIRAGRYAAPASAFSQMASSSGGGRF